MDKKIEEINKEVKFFILLEKVAKKYDECLKRLS